MTVRTEHIDKWVRAYLDGTLVVDSRAPLLFWEGGFPVPSYAFPREDVHTEVLAESRTEPPSEPSFFGPQGPVAQWYDVRVGDRTVPHGAWIRDAPGMSDLLVLSWRPGGLDWHEEDEPVAGHPRDPHKRVEALASSRHVVVERDGVRLAECRHPVLLFETDLPTRYYLPREDVDMTLLKPTSNRSHCPYKGIADQYWSVVGQPDAVNIAWSYSAPTPAVAKIADRVAFYNELVDLTVDDVVLQRAVSPFSQPANRPSA